MFGQQNGQTGQPGQSSQNGQSGAGNPAGQPQAGGRAGEQQQLADERQQMADDLARLEKQMQDQARQLAGNQQSASSKLRDAVSGAEQGDLENRIKRSADGIRRGVDPNSDANESAIAAGLGRLGDQIGQAQRAMGTQGQGNEEALNRVERLRSQMEALTRSGPGNAQNGQPGQRGQQNGGQPGQLGQNGQAGQQGGGGQQGGQPGGQQANGFQGGGNGAYGGYRGGDIGGPGGGRRYDPGYDIGGYPMPQGPERAPSPVNPADIARAYQDALRELNDLRQQVQGQPEPLADLQELIREMQRLDPSRFPGNPAMVEQLRTQVLASVDKLELQLRRDRDDKQPGQIRGGDSVPVPSGYQDAVAEYFRRLSKNQ